MVIKRSNKPCMTSNPGVLLQLTAHRRRSFRAPTSDNKISYLNYAVPLQNTATRLMETEKIASQEETREKPCRIGY